VSPLFPFRRVLRPLIPRGFLRRDQSSEYLFVSDYPRFPGAEDVTRSIERAGFSVFAEAGLAHITPQSDTLFLLLSSLPCPRSAPRDDTLYAHSLARRLLSQGAPESGQPVRELMQWMKRLDEKDPFVFADIGAYCALCQREKRPLPSLAGKMILCALNEEEGGVDPC